MKKRKKRWCAGALAAVFCLAALSACAPREDEVRLYVDETPEDIVISLFTQRVSIAETLAANCAGTLASTEGSNVILYCDSAGYYGEEGLSYRELLLKRLESGEADDLYLVPAEDVLEFDQKGYLYDLSALDCVKNLSQDALRQSTYKEKVFSIPLSYSCFGLIWNVDLLHQYGLEIPQNQAQFLAVCETLKENGILPYGANCDFALCVPAMCVGLSPIYQSDREEALLSELATGETAVSTYLRAGFEFLDLLIERGYIDPQQALATKPSSQEEHDLFAAGECAFIASLCRAKAFEKPYPFTVQMTALPVLEDGEICVVGADNRLAVNPNSEHLQAALALVEAMGSTEHLDQIAGTLGSISAAQGNRAANLPQTQKIIACVKGGGQIPNQDFRIPFNVWNTVKQLCVEICGGMSVDEACRQYDALQQQEIEKY